MVIWHYLSSSAAMSGIVTKCVGYSIHYTIDIRLAVSLYGRPNRSLQHTGAMVSWRRG